MDEYRISRGASCRASKWRAETYTWPQLVDRLRLPVRTGETAAEYRRMTKAEKSAAKDVGGFVGGTLLNGKRSNRTVRDRCLVTLDADKAYPDQWDDVALLVDYRMACYSTHSHTPEEPRLRWVIPLDRTVSPDEYSAIARRLAEDIGIDTMDRTTYEPARLMYWPSCPADGDYFFASQEGPVVCADEVLASYGKDDAWRDTTLWPVAKDEADVVRTELKELGDPREKGGLVGVFCRCYDVEEAINEFLSDVYEPSDTYSAEPRYTYTKGSTYGGVSIYNDGLYLFSRHDTDPAGGGIHCQNAFDAVRIHKYGHLDKGGVSPDPTKAPSYRAMCDFVQSLEPVRELMAAERMAAFEAEFGDLGDVVPSADTTAAASDRSSDRSNDPSAEPEEVEDAEDLEPDTDWVKQLKYKAKTTDLEPTISNVLLIMRNDPRLKQAICYNELLERIVIRRPLPWHRRVLCKLDGDTWTDTDRANLIAYLEQAWGLKNRADIQDAFGVIYAENAWNPLLDYLQGLVWDGTERLDDLLIRYLGAEDTPYVRAVTRKWFTAAVARIFQPGRKFDNMLVLSGPQGIGKSSLVQIMSRGRFSDSLTDLHGKEAFDQLQGAWLIEIAELSGFKRADIEVIKNFISKSEDTYRAAYKEFKKTYKRRCVFFGTTNDAEFLRDRTGNRRFWPVEVRGPEIIPEGGVLVGLEDEVDQLWAEAVQRYKDGEVLWLQEAGLQEAAREAQESATVQDEMVGQLEHYLETLLPDNWEDLSDVERIDFIQGNSTLALGPCNTRRNCVCISEIRCEMCGEDRTKGGGNDMLSRRLANLMNTMPGWHRINGKKRMGPYGNQRTYWRDGTDAVLTPKMYEKL